MFTTIKARLKQGYHTGKFPREEPVLPDRFQGLPIISEDATEADAVAASEQCPVNAISIIDKKPAIDLGKCIFCAKCAEVCPNIRFTSEHRLAAFSREDLIVKPGSEKLPKKKTPVEARKLLKDSLKIRQVSAGGCTACELDINVLTTLAWDMGRFGISIEASPRHSDVVLVTGPVTDNMKLALEKTFAAVSRPSWIVACGACAISGGIFQDSPVANKGASCVAEPVMYIPGCPPHPTTILDALLRLMGREF
ncbi:MAG: 4Fe-4S binding protein [Lentisphaerae bacterium]|jgi:Ni,Fe-hydrogenase III small subunit/ferredoxin|nr:4Fe-4S binding protein [Lentisphaerota bacterium]